MDHHSYMYKNAEIITDYNPPPQIPFGNNPPARKPTKHAAPEIFRPRVPTPLPHSVPYWTVFSFLSTSTRTHNIRPADVKQSMFN